MNRANEILNEIYERSNCNQTEFCMRLGYKGHYTNMSQYLSGNLDISLDLLQRYCDKLNFTLNIEVL